MCVYVVHWLCVKSGFKERYIFDDGLSYENVCRQMLFSLLLQGIFSYLDDSVELENL